MKINNYIIGIDFAKGQDMTVRDCLVEKSIENMKKSNPNGPWITNISCPCAKCSLRC